MRAFFDNFRLALGTFFSNPLRSLLTLLGIVIGVATVVSMMGLIEGLKRKVEKDLTMLGANTFEVAKRPSGSFNIGPDAKNYNKRPDLVLDDLRAVLESCPSVKIASASQYRGGMKVASERFETNANVLFIGGTSGWADTMGVSVASGRFFTDAEDADARSVAVVGQDVTDVLFPGEDAVGKEVRLHGRPLRIIGVFQRRGSFLGMGSQDNQVVVPMQTFRQLFGAVKYLEVDVMAKDKASFSQAEDEVIALLRRRRRVAPNEENNFEITTNESNAKMFSDMSGVITAAGVGVCLLSLIVGGIGILNIMLVSVTERTKEIGVRKALGAKRSRILGQFATEAVVLSLVGGVMGILLGFGVAGLARWVMGIPAVVPVWAVILAVGVSSVTGLVFGIYPAAQAAKLDPVEAMRAD